MDSETEAADPLARKTAIRARAQQHGFDAVGFARAAGDADDAAHLRDYLGEGRHGDMAWMERTADRRADPQALWPHARTVIACAMNYGPVEDPRRAQAAADQAAVSVYARGRDYHEVMRKRLKALAGWISSSYRAEVKVFVDTAPVMEKPLAARAGLGWIGKHTNLVSRRFGSWLFLGEVFTSLELPADAPAPDACGSCDRCLRACPTGALPAPYRIDPRRCLSYLTIEHKGDIAPELAAALGNRVYGCDECLAVCPWNRFATPTPHPELQPQTAALSLQALAALDDSAFRRHFAGTAVKRTGRDRMVRNAVLALAGGDVTGAAAAIAARADDPSPLVRTAARQAQAAEARASGGDHSVATAVLRSPDETC
jgi:epoxyqueuosine reductase